MTPVHFVPLVQTVMKSGNKGVADERSERLNTTQDYQKLQGRRGTAVHGAPTPEAANRLSLPLPRLDWDQMCVRYTLWEMAEMRDSEAARATINSWNG